MKINLNQCGITLCHNEWKVEYRTHIMTRVYYVLEGSAVYESKGTKTIMEKDMLYILPAVEPYANYHDPKCRHFKILWFDFCTVPTRLNPFECIAINENSLLKNMIHILMEMIEECVSFKMVEDQLSILFGMLYNDFQYNNIQEAINYIYRNYHRKISNQELSDAANLEVYYFNKKFKAVTGVTPQKFIESYRMNKAGDLLLDGEYVKDIAEKLGYADAKTFSKAFKRFYGCTPNEYRKKALFK